MISVRPETASLGRTEEGQGEVNMIRGAVSFASYIGNTIRYDVELQNGKVFKVDVQNPWYHQILPLGEKVWVTFPQQITLGIPIP